MVQQISDILKSNETTRSVFTLNLSTKITIAFITIGLCFIATMLYNYQGSKQVNNGLSLVNNESSPVVRYSSEVNSLMRSIEPLMLGLTITRSSAVFQAERDMLETNKSSLASKLEEFKQLPLKSELAEVVSSTLQQLENHEASLIQSIDQLIARQGEIVVLIESSAKVVEQLNQLQSQVAPLLQATLLQLDDDGVISIANEINASITNGLLIIERIGFASSSAQLNELNSQFINWQNHHSNLLPSLIFASDEAFYQQFVRELSSLTLSLLDAVEGSQGLIALQQQHLELKSRQATASTELTTTLNAASLLTGTLLEEAFAQNHALSTGISQRATEQNQTAIVVSLVIIIAIAVISIYITRFMRKAISGFMQELQALSNGVLREFKQTDRSDEFGRLNNDLLQVVKKLKQTIMDIDNSAKLVESSVNTVADTSTDTRKIVQQQKIELENIAAALLEMSSTAQEVAQHTENTHEKILEASNRSADGRQRVQDSRHSVEQVVVQTQQAIATISQLDEGVRSIESIIDTITNIADQTNLLALNAAIEAARAGEQGRGFAVVADEVRSLATRTQESTLEIQQKITSMIGDSKEAVEVISQSEALVSESLEQARLADETIEGFGQIMGEIQDLSHLISTATEEQAATVQELDRSINQITVLADNTNAKAETAESEAVSQVQIVKELEQKVAQFDIVN